MRKVSGDICPAQIRFSPSLVPTCREQSLLKPNLALGALLRRKTKSLRKSNLSLGVLLWWKTKSLLRHFPSLNSATGRMKSLLRHLPSLDFITSGMKSLQNTLSFLFFFILLSGMTSNIAEPIESSATYHSGSQKKEQPDPYQKVETIKIGFLLPISPDKDLLAKSALQGAELAVQQANLCYCSFAG